MVSGNPDGPSNHLRECVFPVGIWPSGIARQSSLSCHFNFVNLGSKEGSHRLLPRGSCGIVAEDARWPTDSSISPFRRPSSEDGERRGIGFVHLRGNQESLPVATHIVGEDVLRGNRLPPVGLKQRDREPASKLAPVVTATAIIFPSADR